MAQRLLVLDFDSVRQRARFAEAENAARAVDELVGQLRVALLINTELVFTDAMIVDGEFFRRMTPSDLAATLGCSPHRLQFVVYSTAATLREALVEREESSDFDWQTAPRDAESPARGAVLEAWLRAAQEGWFGVEKFPPDRRPFRIPTPSPSVAQSLESDAGRSVLAEVSANSNRTLALRRLADERERAESGESSAPSGADLQAIDRWYQGAYLQAVADSNRARWLSFEAPAASRPRNPRRNWRVSTRLIEQCREDSPVAFALAVAQTTELRERFAKQPTGSTLRSIVYGALSATPSASHLTRVLGGIGVRLAIAVGTIIVAFVGQWSTASSWGWVVGGLGLVVLSTVPWADFGSIRDIYRVHAGATVSVASNSAGER